MLRLGNSLSGEPIFMSTGVLWLIHGNACLCLNKVLNQSALRKSTRDTLSDEIVRGEETNLLFRALLTERGNALSLLEEYDKRGTTPVSLKREVRSKVLLFLIGMRDCDTRFYLSGARARIELALNPGPSAFERAKKLDEYEAKTFGRNLALMSRILLVPAEQILRADAKHRAILRTAKTALALEQFGETTGKLPDSLQELVPPFIDAVPIDPFDTCPLRYKKGNTNYVVYSIGPNQRDDGGVENVPGRMRHSEGRADLTFSVNRKPTRSLVGP